MDRKEKVFVVKNISHSIYRKTKFKFVKKTHKCRLNYKFKQVKKEKD